MIFECINHNNGPSLPLVIKSFSYYFPFLQLGVHVASLNDTYDIVHCICIAILYSVNLLFELLIQQYHIANNAVLLTLYPLEIAGKDVHTDFMEYNPPKT